MSTHEPLSTPTPTSCYRHPDRPAGVRCQRCDRVVCAECQKQASVGVHCPECVAGTKQKSYTMDSLPGSEAVATKAIIALNVAVFVFSIAALEATGTRGGRTAGELGINGVFIDQRNEWWRIFTGGFGHSTIFHLGLAMFVVWRVGPTLEQRLGPLLFGLAYGTTMLAGAFGTLLLAPTAFTMGASAGAFGLVGVAIMRFYTEGISMQRAGLINVFILCAFLALRSNTTLGYLAGGLVAGLALGALFFGSQPGAEAPFGRDRRIPALITLGLASALFVACLWAASRWPLAL